MRNSCAENQLSEDRYYGMFNHRCYRMFCLVYRHMPQNQGEYKLSFPFLHLSAKCMKFSDFYILVCTLAPEYLSSDIDWNGFNKTDEKNPPPILTCLKDVVDLHCNCILAQTERRLDPRLPHSKLWLPSSC